MDQEGGQKRNYTAELFVVVVENAEKHIVAIGAIEEAIDYFGPEFLALCNGSEPVGSVNVTIGAAPDKAGWAYRGCAMCIVRDEPMAGDLGVRDVMNTMQGEHPSDAGVVIYRTPKVVAFDPNLDGVYPLWGFHG